MRVGLLIIAAAALSLSACYHMPPPGPDGHSGGPDYRLDRNPPPRVNPPAPRANHANPQPKPVVRPGNQPHRENRPGAQPNRPGSKNPQLQPNHRTEPQKPNVRSNQPNRPSQPSANHGNQSRPKNQPHSPDRRDEH